MAGADRVERDDRPPSLPAAELPPRRGLPRQTGGIPFALGLAIGFAAGLTLVYLATGPVSDGLPVARGDVLLPLVLVTASVLTCIRSTCSFGLGALVSLLATPVFVAALIVEVVSNWG